MATITTESECVASPDADAEARPQLFRIPVDMYDRMVELGLFEGARGIYLWKGQLVQSMTKGPLHESSLAALLDQLFRLVPKGFHVRLGSPTRLDDESEPEPDLSIVRGGTRDYLSRHPRGTEIALAIEVSDSSLRFDRAEKREAYALAGIAEYWVVNIPEMCIDVYSQLGRPAERRAYGSHQRFVSEDEVRLVLDGQDIGRIGVRSVLP